MGSSFVAFEGRDGTLESWLLMLAAQLDDDIEEGDEWLRAYRDHIITHATVGMIGCIDPMLDQYVGADDARRTTLVRATDRALAGHVGASNDSSEIDATAANRVYRAGSLFMSLLLGELATDESSPVDYW